MPSIYSSRTFLGAHLIGAVVAVFAPTDVLDRHSALRHGTEAILQVVPSISSYVANSYFPQVTAFYFCLLNLFGPSLLVFAYRTPSAFISIHTVAQRIERYPILFFVVAASILSPLALICWIGPIGKPWELLPIHSSRLALALIGPLFALLPFLVCCVLGAIFRVWREFFTTSRRWL
jgi:hypothetical protein